MGKELEPYHLFWLEDPTPAELEEGFRLIRRHTTTPLAVGEVFNSIYDCQQLIQEQLIDFIRTTVVHAGGISYLRKIAALAEMYQVQTGSHGATDLSPVCMAAALHFDLRSTISAFRSTCGIRQRPTESSRIPTALKMVLCIPEMRPAWEWTWTKPKPCVTHISGHICRLIVKSMALCTIGDSDREI